MKKVLLCALIALIGSSAKSQIKVDTFYASTYLLCPGDTFQLYYSVGYHLPYIDASDSIYLNTNGIPIVFQNLDYGTNQDPYTPLWGDTAWNTVFHINWVYTEPTRIMFVAQTGTSGEYASDTIQVTTNAGCKPALVKNIEETNITLWPNPCTSYLLVKSGVPFQNDLIIYDMSGKLIKQISIVGKTQSSISVTNLPVGSYLIIIGDYKTIIEKR